MHNKIWDMKDKSICVIISCVDIKLIASLSNICSFHNKFTFHVIT